MTCQDPMLCVTCNWPLEPCQQKLDYSIETKLARNDEGSDFATVTITFANGELLVQQFARYFDDGPVESAAVQAASFIHAFEDTQRYTLEERLGPFGLEWERELEEREHPF